MPGGDHWRDEEAALVAAIAEVRDDVSGARADVEAIRETLGFLPAGRRSTWSRRTKMSGRDASRTGDAC